MSLRVKPSTSLTTVAVAGSLCGIVAAVSFTFTVNQASALIMPAQVIAGPSPGILGVGDVAIASDGTGGVVWRQLSGGVPHIFVSQFSGGRWSAPMQVDAGQPGPATFPAIAAGDGGELLVVWVQPWASESTGGQVPSTIYQLMSSVLEPGSTGFQPPEQVDPNDVRDGTGVYPSLAMAPDGNAYVVYRVVTNALAPNVFQPPGTLAPMRPGDEIVDVRVARFNGLFWSSLGAVNAFPGQVTMRKPTASNAPVIAIDPAGAAIVVWQEPTIDGVARIWARRLFGTSQGFLLAASPQTWSGRPVTTDADAPSLSMTDFAEAKVAFRLDGGSGSPLTTPHVFVNTLLSAFVPSNGAFTGPVPVAGAPTIGAPSVAVDDNGDFQAGFTAAGQTDLVGGNETSAGAPQTLGPADGDPGLATLDPDGGGATVWPGVDAAGRPVVQVRDSFPNGGRQTASLSAPISGPISTLSIGPSGQGDALIAFEQGLSSTAQVVVSYVQVPPHKFFALTPVGWVKPSGATIGWGAAPNVIGSVSYAVLVDGQVKVRRLYGLGYRLSARGLGAGVHRVQVIATDAAGQQTITPVAEVEVDPNPPLVDVRRLAGERVRVRVHDPDSGARARGTLIAFGDGTAAVANRLTVVHAYGGPGRYLITVRCADKVGNHALDHLWMQVR
jgi:hypothetical protein